METSILPTKNRNIFVSFANAFKGIFAVAKEGRNFKIHMLAVVVVTVAGFYFGISKFEWLVVLVLFGVIMALEIVNSAIENLSDLLRDHAGVEYAYTGTAKDMASGAVLLMSIFAVIIAWVIFVPHIFDFLPL